MRSSMNATQEGEQRGVSLADQAGFVILQIRSGASYAVEAMSMFASRLDESKDRRRLGGLAADVGF